MQYVTSIERLAKQEGKIEGKIETARQYLLEVLAVRFGIVPDATVEMIDQLEDAALVETLFKKTIAIGSTAAFQQLLDETVASQN